MKTNELRRGNLVLFMEDGTLFTVDEIDSDGIGVSNSEESTWIEIDQFSGIPLTEEWLLKFGFNLKSEHSFHNYQLPNGFWLSMWMDDEPCSGFEEKGVCYWGETFVPVRYVHQLQNLYQVISGGKELEVMSEN